MRLSRFRRGQRTGHGRSADERPPAPGGRVAVAERPVPEIPALSELRERIAALRAQNRAQPSPEAERALLRARHLAGLCLIDAADQDAAFATAEPGRLPGGAPLPELAPGELTPGLLRAGILRDGCVLVRGLVPRDAALALAEGIDAAYAERERRERGEPPTGALYDEFAPHERFGEVTGRWWIKEGGGLLAADSPAAAFAMFEAFEAAGLPGLVSGYLGEPALVSVHKTTLRRAEPSVAGAWHQDGFFMGPVRALNLWLSLSRCGDEAPGLDILPRRLNDYVATGTAGAAMSWTISEDAASEAAGDTGIVRPIFEPGDALLFDELFLHKTGSDPAMPKPRHAIENWFFGASGFPAEYAPLAV